MGRPRRRLIDRDVRQRPGVLDVRERVAQLDLGEAGDGGDLARADLVGGDALEALRLEEVADLGLDLRAVALDPEDLVAAAQRAVGDLRDREAAEVRGGVEVADLRLERVLRVERRGGDRLEDAVEQLGEVLTELVRADAGAAVAADIRTGMTARATGTVCGIRS